MKSTGFIGGNTKANNECFNGTSFVDKKNELFEMLNSEKDKEKDKKKSFGEKRNQAPKSKLVDLHETNHKENHKMLGNGNYIKQSLSNLRRTFDL